MDCFEIVMDKQLMAREPLKSRLMEIERMLQNPTMTINEAEDAGFRNTVPHWNDQAQHDYVTRFEPVKNW